MLKTVAKLESIVGEKIAHLYLDNDTPLGVVKEMLYQFVAYVAQVEANAKAQADAEAAQKAEMEKAATPVVEAKVEPIEAA